MFYLPTAGKVGRCGPPFNTDTPSCLDQLRIPLTNRIISAHSSGLIPSSQMTSPHPSWKCELQVLTLSLVLRRVWLEAVFPYNLWLCLLKLCFDLCYSENQSIFSSVNLTRFLGNNFSSSVTPGSAARRTDWPSTLHVGFCVNLRPWFQS